MHRNRNRTQTRSSLTLATGLATVALTTAAHATVENDSTTPTGWWYVSNSEVSVIQDRIDAGFRLIDLDVNQTDPYRFSAAFVKNSGEYASGWWWYYGITSETLAEKLDTNNAFLTDLQVYRVDGQKRYAAIMKPWSADDAPPAYWYYTDVSFDFLLDKADQHNARLVDIDTYTVDDQRLFSGIMYRNTGDDARDWWVYSNVTSDLISEKLSQHEARLVDLEDRGNGRFTAIMEARQGQTWWWYYNATSTDISSLTDQLGARVFDIERYTNTNGQTRYMVLLLNNVNALTTEIRRLTDQNTDGGAFGFRLERVNGPTLAALQSDFMFYPASTIKVLCHVHAMKMVEENDTITLNTGLDVYAPGSDSCSDNHDGQTPIAEDEPLGTVLRLMMENSDNERTNAVIDYFSFAWINWRAHNDGGMSFDSALEHKLGCGNVNNDPYNTLTLRDINTLYERIARNQVFDSGATRQTFYDLMLDGNWFLSLLEDERPADMSDEDFNDFVSGVQMARKAGSLPPNGNDEVYLSVAGWIMLPTIPCSNDPRREYVFSAFLDKVVVDPGFGPGTMTFEMMRDELRRALEDYQACVADCDADLNGDGRVDTLDLLVLLQQWGPCAPGCIADIDQNGGVDSQDLLEILAAWGRCT